MSDKALVRRLKRAMARVVVLRRLLREAEVDLRVALKDATETKDGEA